MKVIFLYKILAYTLCLLMVKSTAWVLTSAGMLDMYTYNITELTAELLPPASATAE